MEDKITVKHKGKPCEGKDDSEEAEALVFILAYYVPTRAADTFSDLEQSCLYIKSESNIHICMILSLFT